MHVLEPKHIKLKSGEVEKLIKRLNVSLIQLPKIRINDPTLPEGCKIGDIIRIERETGENKTVAYYRVVSI